MMIVQVVAIMESGTGIIAPWLSTLWCVTSSAPLGPLLVLLVLVAVLLLLVVVMVVMVLLLPAASP
jgi:hypothetical protein